MTREEAIYILQNSAWLGTDEMVKAIEMAIETLSAAAVTHGRLIDADRLKSYIDCGHLRPPTEVCFSELDVCNMIDKAPTVSAEALQGEWIHDGQNFKGGIDWCHCSECGKKTSANGLDMYKFCPNCGAKMEGGDEE